MLLTMKLNINHSKMGLVELSTLLQSITLQIILSFKRKQFPTKEAIFDKHHETIGFWKLNDNN